MVTRLLSSGARLAPIVVLAAGLMLACSDEPTGGVGDVAGDGALADQDAADLIVDAPAADLDAAAETTLDTVDADDGAGACGADRLQWGLGGGLMLPGTDCLDCHREGGSAGDSVFTLAGTVFAGATCPEGIEGAEVRISDDSGSTVTLTTNALGNFYTTDDLAPPFQVSVAVDGSDAAMQTSFTNGSCGACHAEGTRLGFVHGDR